MAAVGFIDNCCTCGGCQLRYLEAQHCFSGAIPWPAWRIGSYTGTTAMDMDPMFGPNNLPAPGGGFTWAFENTTINDLVSAPNDNYQLKRYLKVKFVRSGIYWPPNKGAQYRMRGVQWEYTIDKRINRVQTVRLTTYEGTPGTSTITIGIGSEASEYIYTIADNGVVSESGTTDAFSAHTFELVKDYEVWNGIDDFVTAYAVEISATAMAYDATFSGWVAYDEDADANVSVPIANHHSLTLSEVYDDIDVLEDTEILLNEISFGSTYNVYEVSRDVAPVSQTFAYGCRWIYGYRGRRLDESPWPITKAVVKDDAYNPKQHSFTYTGNRMAGSSFCRLLLADSEDVDGVPEPLCAMSKVEANFGTGIMDLIQYEFWEPNGDTSENAGSHWCEPTGMIDCDRDWPAGTYRFDNTDVGYTYGIGYLALACQEDLPHVDCPETNTKADSKAVRADSTKTTSDTGL